MQKKNIQPHLGAYSLAKVIPKTRIYTRTLQHFYHNYLHFTCDEHTRQNFSLMIAECFMRFKLCAHFGCSFFSWPFLSGFDPIHRSVFIIIRFCLRLPSVLFCINFTCRLLYYPLFRKIGAPPSPKHRNQMLILRYTNIEKKNNKECVVDERILLAFQK